MATKDEKMKEDGLVATSPFSDDTGIPREGKVEDDASDVETWEEKAEEVDAPDTSKELTGDELADVFMAEFLKGDGEGDGDDEPSLGRGVTLDVDMAKHMKRYHPVGMIKGSSCKYIGNRVGENATKRDYYSDIPIIPIKETEKWFRSKIGVFCYYPKIKEDVNDLFLSDATTTRLLKSRTLTEQEYAEVMQCAYRVCYDILERFPEIKWGFDFFYGYDTVGAGSGGFSSLDRRRDIGFIMVGTQKQLSGQLTLNYHHKDERYIYDVIRHEIGHTLSTESTPKKFERFLSEEKIARIGEDKVIQELSQKVSFASAEFILEKDKRRKSFLKEECIAELFSVYTSPWYTKGSLPFGLEEFVKEMIKAEDMRAKNSILTMDSSIRAIKRPRYIPELCISEPLSERDTTKNIYLWDWIHDEWRYFESEDAKNKYRAELERIEADVSEEECRIWIDSKVAALKEKILQSQKENIATMDSNKQVDDYSVGRWIAFPNARMTGKVRQIVGQGDSEYGFKSYRLTSPELDDNHRFKTVGMKLNGHKSFGTKEEAEKYLQEAEGEVRKKILQIVTKDSLPGDNIFDPERFDQNSFEWGAIYWINQIRDAVEEFEDGYVIPDEQFIEMLRPLWKAAKVYAEAHGKDKEWVKNTVLSVPKAFANAFDTLSDGEGVSKEHFLKVLTVEGVCALAEGDIDTVHELENYYYRKGKYSPKGGYEVGRFVVIIKYPPSQKYESERIRRIIAIHGEKDDDDPMLVFWNTSKSGIVERKASQCSKPFHKCDDAYDWWFVENGDGARKVKNNPMAEEEKERGDEIYKAILSSMGITEDAEPDMADPDFWAKHDKARHGGHFDPETMTCKLREKYEQGEKIENLKDEMDDIEVEDTPNLITQESDIESKIKELSTKKREFVRQMQKRHPDKDLDEILNNLSELGKIVEDAKDKTTEEKKAAQLLAKDAGQWLLKGAIRIPEDLYKVQQAREVAKKAKVDPFKYNTPQECINANSKYDKGEGRLIDPDTVPELSDKQDMGYGVVTYQVQDDKDGQMAMRKILNSHYGRDENGDFFSPWCLLHDDGHGKLSNQAWDYWNQYNALPKRVAFKDGKLISFMATDKGYGKSVTDDDIAEYEEESGHSAMENSRFTKDFKRWHTDKFGNPEEEWWDINDESHEGIPIGEVEVPNDPLHRKVEMGELVKGGIRIPQRQDFYIGEKGKSGYRVWFGDNPNQKKMEILDDGTEVQYRIDGGVHKVKEKDFLAEWMGNNIFDVRRHDTQWIFRDSGEGGRVYIKNIGEADFSGAGKILWFAVDINAPGIDDSKMYHESDIDSMEPDSPSSIILKRVRDLFQDKINQTQEVCKEADRLRMKYDEAFKNQFPVEDAGLNEGEGTSDFWAKHDKQHHHGHFDPETMTCSLRDEAKAAKEKRQQEDEVDDMNASDVEEQSAPKPHKEKSGGISRIFTGSGADYSKPSLLHVGEGEGRQVYGWGLYGSSVRGVGKSYASQGSDAFETEVKYQGDPIKKESPKEIKKIAATLAYAADHPEWYSSPEDVFNSRITEYESHTGLRDKELGLQYKEWAEEEKRLLEIYQETRDKWEVNKARNVLYEQTFFLNRAPGDESHLLKWYEPTSETNLYRINEQLKAEGIDARFTNKVGGYALVGSDVKQIGNGSNDYIRKVEEPPNGMELYHRLAARIFGSEAETSRFLARADIDGVKYPVDSYGGKGVKDGDEAGWNYVSFRDDNIRIDKKYVDGKKVYDFQELMAKKLPGVDAISVLQQISKMGSPEEMAAEFRRILRKRKPYGVPYQGSKSRIAKAIVDVLPSGKRFVDLFSGGGAVTHAAMDSGKYSKFRMNDIDGRGQRLFLEGVQGKWDDYSRESMTDEEFAAIKGTPESLAWSFNGLGRNLAHPVNGRDHAAEQIRRVQSLSSLKDKSNAIESSETDYSEVKLQPGDVVYADVPYESTDQRGYDKGKGFDKDRFVKWAQEQSVPVYVSEYTMPEGWTEISAFDVSGMRGGSRKEKLFVQSKFAGARPIANSHDSLNEVMASAIEAAFGIGQDSIDKKMVELRGLFAKKFPDKDSTAIISELGNIKSAEEQKAYIRSILKGK